MELAAGEAGVEPGPQQHRVEGLLHVVVGTQLQAGDDAYVLHADFPGWRFFVTFSPDGVAVGFKVEAQAEVELTFAAMGAPAAHTAEAPPVTARFLRSLPLGEIQEAARRGFRREAERMQHWPEFPAHWADVFAGGRRPGLAGRSDLELARLAGAYLEKVHSRSPTPTKELAEELSISPSQLRNLLYLARSKRRGLLTAPQSGKAGGELTEKALDLLRREDGA